MGWNHQPVMQFHPIFWNKKMLFHLILSSYNFWPLFFGTHMLNWMVFFCTEQIQHLKHPLILRSSAGSLSDDRWMWYTGMWYTGMIHGFLLSFLDRFQEFLSQIKGGMVFEIFYMFSIFKIWAAIHSEVLRHLSIFVFSAEFLRRCGWTTSCGVSGVPKRWGVILQFGIIYSLLHKNEWTIPLWLG